MTDNPTDITSQVRAHLAALQPVDRMPPSALMREAAESRRLLRQLADTCCRRQVLDDARRQALGSAIADAVAYREPSGECTGCTEHPAGLCEDHAADLDRTDDYLALARALGIEAGE